MNPEELKDKWRSLNASRRPDNGEPAPFYNDPLVDNVTSGRVTSARDRLMRRYRMMFSALAPIGIGCALSTRSFFPWWGIVAILVFFLVAASMDYYLYRGIRSIDLSVDGVEKVAEKARFFRRRHHLFQLILLPLAIVVVSIYFSTFREEAMRWGLYAGLAFGAVVGLAIYIQMMRDYKSMS